MDQCRTFHPFGKGDNVLRPNYVSAQRAFESRIKRYVSGAVDYDIDVVGNALSFLLRVADICLTDVPAENNYLVAYEPFECTAITLTKRVERRCSYHVVPET